MLPHEYYLPAATGGEVLTNRCWRTRESIRIDRPGLLAELQVMTRDHKRFIEIQWELQPGRTLELSQSAARVYLGDQVQPAEITLQQSLVGYAMELQPVTPLVGGYLPPPVETALRNYWMYVALPDSLPDSFRVLVPAYAIDGQVDSLPEVRFTKVSSVQFLAPIQC